MMMINNSPKWATVILKRRLSFMANASDNGPPGLVVFLMVKLI